MFLISCSSLQEKSSENLLSDAEMIDALVEINLLEAANKLNFLENPLNDSTLVLDYYDAFFASRPYSYESFKLSFSTYSKQPKKMQELLDSTLKRVQILELE